ncbi:MAG: arginine--tRNA ligase [Xanthomonadales bacterium]|nr:arginine--tRNA ligase [Xanthomonadales bacterium]
MKTHLQELITQALLDLRRNGDLPADLEFDVQIERARSPEHGDYSSNIAMVLAKAARKAPRDLATAIIDDLLPSKHVEKVSMAGPGFINFSLSTSSLQNIVSQILRQGDGFGRVDSRGGQKVTVEFVSANPTGPLHVGHGRGAAYGASLAALLDATGHDVHREYYVNDHGRQMEILATSVWLRYLELGGTTIPFPGRGYRGEYVYEIARTVRQEKGDELRRAPVEITEGLPEDGEGEAGEKYIDALTTRAKELLGDKGYRYCFEAALKAIVEDIRGDLREFNVEFEEWFSERQLADSGAIDRALERLRSLGHVYERDGALWFDATRFGDEKDRVVVRENGVTTYFASDIAYLLDKLGRFDHAIYVFGADHHGYVARLHAAARGLGEDPERVEILLVQFAHLFRGGEKVQMSTRSGEFVTLRELREEVGTDAARFFYVMRSHEQHLDFDLELAKSQSADNPVYYIQYAHARVASLMRKLEERGLGYNQAIGEASLDRLDDPSEINILRELMHYPEILAAAARTRGPQLLAHYLRELAQTFQSYYNNQPILVDDDEDLRNARLCLSLAVQQILRNGLDLLGVSAPERM